MNVYTKIFFIHDELKKLLLFFSVSDPLSPRELQKCYYVSSSLQFDQIHVLLM